MAASSASAYALASAFACYLCLWISASSSLVYLPLLFGTYSSSLLLLLEWSSSESFLARTFLTSLAILTLPVYVSNSISFFFYNSYLAACSSICFCFSLFSCSSFFLASNAIYCFLSYSLLSASSANFCFFSAAKAFAFWIFSYCKASASAPFFALPLPLPLFFFFSFDWATSSSSTTSSFRSGDSSTYLSGETCF